MKACSINVRGMHGVFLLASIFGFCCHAATFQGFERLELEIDGTDVVLLAPHEAGTGRPWLWHANPIEADSAMNAALLRKGFHIGWIDLDGVYGHDEALSRWDAFYSWMTRTKGLSEKPAIAARAEGALAAHCWAAAHPEQAACIYAEMPWLHMDAVRQRLEQSPEHASDRATIRKALGLPEAGAGGMAALAPLDRAAHIGAMEIPILHICSEKDSLAPKAEHTDIMYAAYRRAGRGVFEIIRKSSEKEAAIRDIHVATLYFLLRHTNQLSVASFGKPIDEMPEWTPADFAGRTDVSVLDDILIIEEGRDMTGVTWTGEAPRLDYEISLEAMRLSGSDFFCGLTAPYHDTVFSLIVGGWGGTCVGISSLGWLDAYHNDTARFRSFEDQRWYRIRLRVSDDSIEAWIDDDKLVDATIGDREVDIRWEMAPTKPLGIATWRTTGAFRNIRIRQN